MPLRVLLVDDNPDDRALVRRELAREFPDLETVEVVDDYDFEGALDDGGLDLVLTDLHLSWGSGLSVLGDVLARYPDVPVIMVTGTGNEEVAVEAMKAGLSEYVLKSPEHYSRLAAAVRSTLERSEEHKAAREVEARYRTLVEQIPAITYIDIVEGGEARPLYVSPQVESLLGVSSEAWLSDTYLWRGFLHPEDRDRAVAGFLEGVASGRPFTLEYRIVAPDGRTAWIEERAATYRQGGSTFLQGVMLDTTERRQAEAALRSSEAFAEQIVASTSVGIAVLDRRLRYIVWNRFMEELSGRSLREVVGLLPWEAFPLAEEETRPAMERALAGETVTVPDQYVPAPPPGRDAWTSGVASPLRDVEGKIAGVIVSVSDITERKAAEDALRQAEAQYRTLVERLPAVVYLAEFGFPAPWLYVSPRVEEVLGFTPEEWLADPETWWRQVHPEDRDRVEAEENLSRDSGDVLVSEYRMIAKDGRVVWVRDEAEVVGAEGDRPAVLRGLMYDVTEARQVEAELRASREEIRRLLGALVDAQEEERARIAADIHDDSIQVMTAVGLRLEAVRRGITDPDGVRSIEKLRETVATAIARLRHLLLDLRPRALDEDGLAAALRQHLDRMKEQAPIDWHLEDGLSEQPPQELRTALYRIALEALANVGKHSRAARVEVALRSADGGFGVRIRDDGVGFDPGEVRWQPGHLGLSAMRERAEMLGGWCRVESAPGRGTTVEFWAPGPIGNPST